MGLVRGGSERQRARPGRSVVIRRACIAVFALLALGACSDDSTSSDEGRASTTRETRTSTTEPAVALFNDLPAGPGTYQLLLRGIGAPRLVMTATLPEGWTGAEGWVLRKNGGVDNREGIAITFWAPPDFVYGDACHWSDSAIEAEPTVDFMAEALARQAMRSASTPRELAVGGHRVVELQLSVPDDLEMSTCDEFEGGPAFESWSSADGHVARYHQGAGQIDLVRLVDVDGELLIIDVATWPELPAGEHDEIMSLLDSMTFSS